MAHRGILPAFVAFNLVVKLLWLGRNELAHDEPYTLYWALRPLAEFADMLWTENNPPLHFLLTRLWLQVVPFDAAWLRLPSALFGALAVWPLYLAARRLGGERAAIATALVFSLNTHLHGYAHEVRSYALFLLLTCAAMWQLLRLLDGGPRAAAWLAVVNVLMVHTHFFGWLVVGLQALMLFAMPGGRSVVKRWGVVAAIAVASTLPYAAILARRATESIGRGTWLQRPEPEEIYNMVWRWSNAPVPAVLFLLLVAHTLWRHRPWSAGLRMAAVWALVPLLGMYLVSLAVPIYLDRYLAFAAPGFALLVGLSLAALPGRLAGAAIIATGLGLGLTFRPWERSPHRPSAVLAKIDAWSRDHPGAGVLVVPPWYKLTLDLARPDGPERFRSAPPGYLHEHWWRQQGPGAEAVILVDADASDKESVGLLHEPTSSHRLVDKAEASHKVTVSLLRHGQEPSGSSP